MAAFPHLQPILRILCQLGMRLGETLNLTWNRVDHHCGFITFRALWTSSLSDVPLLTDPGSMLGPEWMTRLKRAMTELTLGKLTSKRPQRETGKPCC